MDTKQEDKVRTVLGLLQDEDGFVGREIPGTLLHLPAEVKIEADTLLYRLAGFLLPAAADDLAKGKPKIKRQVRGLLDDFVRLAYPSEIERHSSSDIAEFTKKWGGLFLCHHGLPYTHQPTADPADQSWYIRCSPIFKGGMFAEPIQRWRELAMTAFLVMRLATILRRVGDSGARHPLRQTITKFVNKWLSNGSVTVVLIDRAPDLTWPGGVEIRLSASVALYGVLAVQLAMAVTLSRQFYFCAECGRLFTPVPSRRPRTGRRAFCLQCGRSAAVRHAMRDMRRQRKRNRNDKEREGK